MNYSKNKGFTLVELMVAIVLGLLIVAAGLQLFFTGSVSVNLQKAMSDIQENSNFGLNYITSDLRKVNYQADQPQITSAIPFGGVILGSNNFPSDLTQQPVVDFWTGSAKEGSTKLTNVASDQLTVQFYTDTDTIDCEGNVVTAGNMIIQRYFIDAGSLKCDSGQYPKNKPTGKDANGVTLPYQVSGMGANAQILLKNVEYMRILLAVSVDKLPADDAATNEPLPANNIVQKNFRYIEPKDYPTSGTLPRVRGIQIGLLVRANDRVASRPEIKAKNDADYKVLDKNVKLNTSDSQFIREVVTQTIALRNAMGASS